MWRRLAELAAGPFQVFFRWRVLMGELAYHSLGMLVLTGGSHIHHRRPGAGDLPWPRKRLS
jgi:hypothetical protein